MIAMRSGPARVPLLAPSLFRTYGLRSALIFVVMIVGIGTGTFMLREAAGVALVIGGRTGSGTNGPTISAWLDTPGGLAIANDGDLYFADSNNHVIDRSIGARPHRPWSATHESDFQETTAWPSAQLDTPDGVALAPDGDLIVADSHNDRIRRVDRADRRSSRRLPDLGETGYDGDDKPAIEAALNTPNAVWPRRRTATSTSPIH